jgi:hypothetical protein
VIGKVDKFTPPKINQGAPKDRQNRWHLVAEIKSPFTGDPPATEFGFWFNYFWAEVADLKGITPVQQQKAAEVFFSVFDETTPPPYTVRADFARRDDAFKENALRQLLLIGFKRVAIDPPRTTPRQGAPLIAPPPLTVGGASVLSEKYVE